MCYLGTLVTAATLVQGVLSTLTAGGGLRTLTIWGAKGIKTCYLENYVSKRLPKRGFTQREALATRSVEKNLELIFCIITPPILVPK